MAAAAGRSEEHTSELQSHLNLVCRLLLEKKNLFLAIIQTFFLISWFSLLLLQLLRHLFYRHLKLHRQRYILIVRRLMLVMVVFFIAFRWIHLSTPLIRLFLLVLILLLMPTLNFLPVWIALSLLRFRLPSRLPMMFILWMVAMMVVIIPSRTV